MSVLIFLLALSVLVVIHELGHYLAACIFGVKAEEFGFGFPPRLIGFVQEGKRWKKVRAGDRKEYKKTIWSINWLPLGGFVRIKGEQEDGINDADSIHTKPIWQRIIIIAAGVIMNWLLAWALFTIVFLSGTASYLDDVPSGAEVRNRSVMITQVLKDSPSAKAGIEPGDEIISIAGLPAGSSQEARRLIGERGVQATDIRIERDGAEKTIAVTPDFLKDLGRPGIGVALDDIGIVRFGFFDAVYYGAETTLRTTQGIVVALATVVRDLFVARKVPADLSGPVGIAVMADHFAKQGISPFIQFAALLSVNLAVINFLPIPALDGGRVLFLLIEKLRRKPMSRHLEIGIHNIAFIVLILIILLVTARDVVRYGGTIVGGLKGIVGM